MSDLSKVGYYIRTYDRDIFITQEQRDILYEGMDKDMVYFDINDSRIMMRTIKEIVPSTEYEKSITGGYYCPRHPEHLVIKGKTCGYCG